MFFWKKKRSAVALPDLSWLNADMHSHLLPGIDDGSQEAATSVEMIRGLMQLGYKKIITTPHVLWEIYPNTTDVILQKKAALQRVLEAENVDVELHAAAEYFIDEHFENELKNKVPLLTLKDNLVLVEFSMITAPLDLMDILFEMQLQNYQPIIAHPERYVYLRHRKEFFDQLKNAGCFLQLNLLSLTGHYGTAVQELAEYLVKKSYYDYAGTDMHNPRHLEALRELTASAFFTQLRQSGRLKNSLL